MKVAEVLSSALILLLASSAAAVGLKLRHASSPAAASPAPKGTIRPGVVIRITSSKTELQAAFAANAQLRYEPHMEEMLGRDFVVVDMQHGGACTHSPQHGSPDLPADEQPVWCFPLNSVKLWEDTKDAKAPPAEGKAMKAVGLPTRPEVDIAPPARDEAPWDFSLKGKNLLDPVAPPFEKHVDLEKTRQPLPPWLKVQQVASVECMEKLHRNPHALCQPEDYVDYKKVVPPSTTEKPISPTEAKALKKQIKHLKSQIKSLSKKPEEPKEPAMEGVRMLPTSINDVVEGSEGKGPAGGDNRKMDIGRRGSAERMHQAQGHGERQGKKLQKKKEPNAEMNLPKGMNPEGWR